jgi:ribosome biogenesis GTPase
MSHEFDYEEAFHGKNRKESRKERRHAQETDRSKFKKTDKKEKAPQKIDPTWQRARVVAITGEGVWVNSAEGRLLASLKGFLKNENKETKNLIAVGDWVRFTKDLAIAHIEERYSFLARTDIRGTKEQLIAVNVDQVIIAVSIVNPPLKPSLIDRYLIAAAKGNIHPIIVINKIDLLEEASEEEKLRYKEFVSAYERLGIPILSVSTTKIIGLEALRSLLKDKVTVFSGQSGVGKSSLLNSCYGLKLKIGELAQKTAKGTHTTTTSELISLPTGGFCVDTPGVRSFGLWKLKKEDVISHFHDFSHFHCKYLDCFHINEPQCGVLKALEKEELSSLRYESYRTLLDEATGGSDNRAKKKGNDEFD